MLQKEYRTLSQEPVGLFCSSKQVLYKPLLVELKMGML
jgi:hypothetical protein